MLAAVLASGACGGGSERDVPGDAGGGGAADAPFDAPEDPLGAFSAESVAAFHLIADGRTADGHARVLFARKVIYPALGPSLTITSVGPSRVVNGIFAAYDANRADAARLFAEASAHAVSLVRADLAIPHRVCGTSDLLDQLSWKDSCPAAPRQISFASVSLAAAANAANGDALDARIAPHLTDGGVWGDVIEGGVTWHLGDGRVLESKLEVSCIGSFRDTGDAVLFDSPACRERYALAQ